MKRRRLTEEEGIGVLAAAVRLSPLADPAAA
jgi:hypothetical protein